MNKKIPFAHKHNISVVKYNTGAITYNAITSMNIHSTDTSNMNKTMPVAINDINDIALHVYMYRCTCEPDIRYNII